MNSETHHHHHHHRSHTHHHHHHHPDHPDWNHYGHLLLCLFLTVTLSVLSALDAEQQCLLRAQEQTAISQLLDDDAVAAAAASANDDDDDNNDGMDVYEQQEEDDGDNNVNNPYYQACKSVIQQLVLPAGLGTASLCVVAYGLLWYIILAPAKARRRKQQQLQQQQQQQQQQHATTSSFFNRDGLVRVPPQQQQQQQQTMVHSSSSFNSSCTDDATTASFSKWLTILFLLVAIILGLQLWWVGNIMLLPRILDNSSSSGSNNNSNHQNPYTSLAAVDRYGHVGDNANLYYLTWLSTGLATALVYQIGTALVRAVRSSSRRRKRSRNSSTSRQQQQQQQQQMATEQLQQQQQQQQRHYHEHEFDDLIGFLPPSHTSSTSFMEFASLASSSSSSSKHSTAAAAASSSSSSSSIASIASNASAAAAVALSKSWFFHAAAYPWETWKASQLLEEQQQQQQSLQQQHQKQQQAYWYNSLYKLRIRTGIWTAALIASWIVAASSQYVALQVLWPAYQSAQQQQQKQEEEASLYPSWHVCRVIQRQQQEKSSSSSNNSSSSSYGNNNVSYAVSSKLLPPQFCHRTMAAWLAGVLSTILCATAIGMHLTAKQCFRSKQRQQQQEQEQHHLHDDEHDNDSGDKFQPATMTTTTATTNQYDDFFMSSSTWYARQQPYTIDNTNSNSNTLWQQKREHRVLSWKRMVAHHPRLPLRTELALSLLLSVITGFNAVFCTGVQGPAATVGNLYYASWLAFLFCVRVALGCLEEFYRLEEDEEHHHHDHHHGDDDDNNDERQQQKHHIQQQQHELHPDISTADSQKANRDPVEKNRLGHVRSYFFLGLFSIICAASAYDAASNQRHRRSTYNYYKYFTITDLTRAQVYMMVAPIVVAVQSLILFALCLSKRCYPFVSSFWCGGLCSIVSFGLWLGNLILTMHSDNSWAVNAIGEIKMANLYYFSWASMITSGLQMSWYVKKLLGIKMKDFLSVVWLAIVKVCFVILGASLHIWHSISDNCEFDEITSGAVTFCSRYVVFCLFVSLLSVSQNAWRNAPPCLVC